MVLSDIERRLGMREFSLRTRGRVIVFEAPGKWWMHIVDTKGRSVERYWLSFADVRDQLKDQPHAFSQAEALDNGREV
jgi:hypothetical protein